MGLDIKLKKKLHDFLDKKFKSKISSFKRPTTLDKNFAAIHTIPEKDRRMYSGVASLLTSFGQNFYEEIAVLIASENSDIAKTQFKSNLMVSKDRTSTINEITRQLVNKTRKPNRIKEMNEILSVPNRNLVEVNDAQLVDVYIKQGNKEYYFELKTVLGNVRGQRSHKDQILKWVSRENRDIHVALVYPYNPYHPEPYKRHGSNDLFELGEDLLVGEAFWDLIGGKNTYEDIQDAFKTIGTKYWEKLSAKF